MSGQHTQVTRRSLLLAGALAGLTACSRPGAAVSTSAPARASSPAPESATSAAEPSTSPATPDRLAGLGIEALRTERWGGDGDVELVRELPADGTVRRYQLAYRSDGITVDGFAALPPGDGPFPVIVMAHGWVLPSAYDRLTDAALFAGPFARAGFLVLHPSFRNHPNSGDGPNPYRIGYARDVLHLIPMARRLSQGDGKPVGLWAHSMGGPVGLRALAVMPDQIGAGLLSGALSGDEAKNYDVLVKGRAGTTSARPEVYPLAPGEDPDLYRAISPGNFLDGLRVPLQLHHGGADSEVPLQFSVDLDAQLTGLGTPHEFFTYPGQPHNVTGAAYQQFVARTIAHFRTHLG